MKLNQIKLDIFKSISAPNCETFLMSKIMRLFEKGPRAVQLEDKLMRV